MPVIILFIGVLSSCGGGSSGSSGASAVTPMPGVASSLSTLSLTNATVVAGVSTSMTIAAIDNTSAALTVGGDTVSVNYGASSVGTIVDNGDGSYLGTETFTIAKIITFSPTINGIAFSSTLPQLTVQAAAADAGVTTITAPANATANVEFTVTVHSKDAFGNQRTGTSDTVILSAVLNGGPASPGVVTASGNGVYSGAFTMPTDGTAVISGAINGNAITSGDATLAVAATLLAPLTNN